MRASWHVWPPLYFAELRSESEGEERMVIQKDFVPVGRIKKKKKMNRENQHEIKEQLKR